MIGGGIGSERERDGVKGRGIGGDEERDEG